MFRHFVNNLIVILAFLLLLPFAYAHTLEIDGSIGVTMHIEPNDAPVVGKQSIFFINIQDTQNKFDPKYCNCTLAIQYNEKTIGEFPIITNGSYNKLDFVFPKSGGYLVSVIGKPTIENAFQEFEVNYEYYIKESNKTDTYKNPLLNYLPYILLIAGIIIASMFIKRK